MAKVLVTDTYLSDIADAIREKNGSADTYTPAEMAEAIEDIDVGIHPSGSVSITQNGTHDVTNYASANVNVQSVAPTLISKTITENGTYDAEDDSADGYSSVTVDVEGSGGAVAPFDTYEFNVPNDINYQDATGTALRTLATFTYHQAFKDKLAEYANITETDYPFARDGCARIMCRVEPKNKSQIVPDSTYRKHIRKDSIYHMKVSSGSVSRATPYLRARWDLGTNGTFSYSGQFVTNNDNNGFDFNTSSGSGFEIRTQLSANGPQMIAAGDYVVKFYDVTWSVADVSGGGSGGADADALIKKTWPTGDISTTATSIDPYQLYHCTGITSASGVDVTAIGNCAFQGCTSLASANFPKLEIITDSLFNQCALTYAVFPACKRVNYYGLAMPTLLGVDLGGVPTSSEGFKGTFTMNGATNLDVVVLRGNAVWPLNNINDFQGTKFESGKSGGTLYVPQSLISSYQAASNWQTILGYANNSIQAIEGSVYETKYVDGTTIPS